MVSGNISQVKRTISDVSAYLRSWYAYIYGEKHIDRTETIELYQWIKKPTEIEKPQERVMLLIGDAGSGKSVVMRDLLMRLENEKIPVLGIKSDVLFSSKGDLDTIIGFEKPVKEIIKEYASKDLVVVLIDQIDALSSILTSDRGSLHSVNTFVDEISKETNVRVVVSCRLYDQQYDPALERYGMGQRTLMRGLPMVEVDETLQLAGITINKNEQDVKEFLQNPLNLFLFCKVNNGQLFNHNRPSRTLLYDALWKQLIIDDVKKSDHTDTQKLVNCLDYITKEMYEHQSLAMTYSKIESRFPDELSYLCSCDLVYGNSVEEKLQFLHQSLFDYVYARMFLRNGKTIQDVLSGIHQGLFIRLRLKQILFYLRDIDSNLYFENLRLLLFATNPDGSSSYRFHLKHLMLTNIGFQKDLIPGEEEFINKYILQDECFSAVYLDSVNTKVGLDLYNRYVNSIGGLNTLSEADQIQYLGACERVLYDEPMYALNNLQNIDVDDLKTKAQQRYGIIVDRAPVSKDTAKVISLLLAKLEPWSGEMSLDLALMKLVSFEPEFVQKWLVRYVKKVVDEKKDQLHAYDIDLGHSTKTIYDTLKKQSPEQAFGTSLQIVRYLCEKTAYESENDAQIKTTGIYLCYQRDKQYCNSVEELLTDLLDYYEIAAKGRPKEVVDTLNELAYAEYDGLVLIPISAYRTNIQEYIQEAYELSKRIILIEPSSSVLKYHAKELFRVLFPLLSNEKKDEIMDVLSTYNPVWEKKMGKLYQNDPITYVDFAKAQYYALLDKDEIIKYPAARACLFQQKRMHRGVENREPMRMQVMEGWKALKNSSYKQLPAKSLAKTMIEINRDDFSDWNKPTRTGHSLAIKQQIHERPDVIYEAYCLALKNKDLDIEYPLDGIEDFLKCKYDTDKVNSLVNLILDRLDRTLANNSASHMIQVARLVDRYYENQVQIPQTLFDWICRIAKEWDDSEYKTEAGRSMSFQDGINQVRGCAAEGLLYCYQNRDWEDAIFDALFAVANTGAVSTRAAVVFRLAVLLRVNQQRCFELFLAMVHDYPASLLALPLHDQNPLLYMINNHFQDLLPYFEACIKEPRSFKDTVVLLWFAWIRHIKGAEDLLYRMADQSKIARSSLIHAIWHYYQPTYRDQTWPILLRYLKYDEKETGESYDYLFNETIMKFNLTDRNSFLRKYTNSAACKYCSHYFMEFMGGLSREDPALCLEVLPYIYMKNKNAADDWRCSPSRLIDFLITAYNAIKKYNKEDATLEQAMDLMDEWLHDNVNRQYLFNCFRLLDN